MLVNPELPLGWEVAEDTPRPPRKGEYFLGADDWQITQCSADYTRSQRRVIVRKSWVWPEWLKARYIFMNDRGHWFATNTKPQWLNGNWDAQFGLLPLSMTSFVPPEGAVTRYSLRERPYVRGTDLITNERLNQQWSTEHDDQHIDGALAVAASVYCLPQDKKHFLQGHWPWENPPKEYARVRELAVAGALIAAEIDRINREV